MATPLLNIGTNTFEDLESIETVRTYIDHNIK